MTPKGAWFCSRDPFFCATVDLEKFTLPLGELLSTNARTTDFAYHTYGAWATHAKA